MLLGAEVGLLIYGIYVLISGKYTLGKDRTLTGSKARLLGVLCLLPLPAAFVLGVLYGALSAFVFNQPASPVVGIVIEIFLLVIIIVIISVLGKRFYL